MTDAAAAGAPEPQLSADAVQHNLRAIEHARSSLALVAGAAAGILGLQSLQGFVFYLVVSAVMSLSLYVTSARMQPALYMPSASQIWTQGIFDNLSSYVLFWTLFTGLVHVYE